MSRPITIVTWRDAVQHSDGHTTPLHKPAIQRTYGVLLKYDETGISVAGEENVEDGTWRDESFIPGELIVSVETVEFVDDDKTSFHSGHSAS